jgi:hypothetical protein
MAPPDNVHQYFRQQEPPPGFGPSFRQALATQQVATGNENEYVHTPNDESENIDPNESSANYVPIRSARMPVTNQQDLD